MPLSSALLYCRPGFEKECAAEAVEHASALGIGGYAKATPDGGYVVFTPHSVQQTIKLRARLRWDELVFSRQLLFASELTGDLPLHDRATPLLAASKQLGARFSALQVETADTNEAKALLGFCRKFSVFFDRALRAGDLVAEEENDAPRLHLFFLSSSAAYVGVSDPGNSSPYYMGIPRLKLPRDAPSRATLKLAEAFLGFLTDADRKERLREGLSAVDLGASPGGWTYHLVRHGLHVTAVDNGPMAESLMRTGLVEHLREDAFHFRPRRQTHWMVCDLVESPARVARLVGEWIANGWCRETIFNLKLPMKKRYDEITRCRVIIEDRLRAAGTPYRLRLKQLYHDREEVTGHLRTT